MNKVISSKEAVDLIKDGMTVAVSGFIGFGLPEELLSKAEEKFLKENSPKNLFVTHVAGIAGDGKGRGLNHFAHKGMIRKLFSGNNSLCPVMGEMIASNDFPAYMAPQGVISHLFRAIAGGKPGVITHVGLKTFADPRVEGCKINDKCKEFNEDFVELINLRGKEYLFYPSFPIDVCLIRGTTADEFGNVTLEREAVRIEQFEMAAATHNSGGIVIVQVERLAARGTLNPRDVVVPGFLVDYIVVGAPENNAQHYWPDEASYVPSWSGETRVPLSTVAPMPLNVRKICARRGAFEIKRGGLINLGIGVPTSVSAVASEEGIANEIVLSIESGVTGGVPASGLATGGSYNPEAIIKQPDIFDVYDGGGIDVAYLGAAEIDEEGNINVSKYAGKVTGPGGFINITQNAKKVCFLGTFTAGKMEVEIKDGKLNIIKDSNKIKFVKKVEQITFSGEYSKTNEKQQVLIITERAVFELRKEGITLIEIAPGVDLEKDILAKMDFKPIIDKDLKLMDERIFKDELMGLKNNQ